jgi:ABC-type microcin C transport system permease subunit YejB
MTRLGLRRLVLALPTLWLVLASLLTPVVPGAPVERMPGQGATPFPKHGRGPSQEARLRWQKLRGQNDW